MAQTDLYPRRGALPVFLLALSLATPGWTANPKESNAPLESKVFFKPELYLSSAHQAVEGALAAVPNRTAWEGFYQQRGESLAQPQTRAWIDPRSGAATNLMLAHPLIPGRGVGNRLTASGVAASLGRTGDGVDAGLVEQAVRRYISDNRGVLGVNLKQLGTARITQVNPDLWQVSIPQVYKGIPVRDARLAATISHGNLVLIGTETWGNVVGLDVTLQLDAEQVLALGFDYVEGRSAADVIVRAPRLEIVPVAPQEHEGPAGFRGQIGSGYRHRLVWSFVFERPPDDAGWEVIVDAHDREVIAFQDINLYAEREVKGGVYPLTSTGICPNNETCGTMQSGWPMPWADTGFASPNNFTNSAGVYNYTSGTATTTLTGKYVDIVDNCGAVSNSSSTGTIDLAGSNNQHDCTTGGGSSGNTASSRSAFYEVNKIAEQARGWLPTNTWLQKRLTTNVNINNTCNAFWSPSAGTINFYRSGGGCRNTGELAGVFDHEWGHGMDDNDAAGALSNSSEAYADIAAIYRLQTSCVGHGFFWTSDKGCGQTADGTGFNANEAQVGAAHCDLDCSGVRDADWDKHSDHTPDTALGFVCSKCNTSTGPCGRQVHCAAAPTRQAAWDFVARDLRAAPFNHDSQTAFVIANKIFYQGSGNVGSWHSCTCGSTSSGCGSTNGYMQWLAADDDNGNLNDGTPHMTALYAAFNRHGIACSTPTVQNGGCSGGPTAAPVLTATPDNFKVNLSWNGVSGATRYWVFRTEGHAGCDFGKALIAEVTDTTYTDTQVANGRTYYYNVVAAGSSSACFGRASNCANATPAAPTNPDFSVSCTPSSLSIQQGSNGTSSCTVSSSNNFSSAVTLSCTGLPSGASCGFSPNPVTPPANGSSNSTLTVTVGASTATGSYPFNVQGVSGSLTRTAGMNLSVTSSGGPVTVFFDNFETDQGWTRNASGTDTATTGLWERGDPEATNSSGPKQLGTTVSGVNDLVTGRLAGSSAGTHDIDGGVTSIRSAQIALPSTGTLTLSFSYYMAHGTNSSSADFLRVKIVGSTTTTVFEELGAANDDDAVWASANVSLNSFAGQTIRILIEAADASTASLVEAAVDDVKITQQ